MLVSLQLPVHLMVVCNSDLIFGDQRVCCRPDRDRTADMAKPINHTEGKSRGVGQDRRDKNNIADSCTLSKLEHNICDKINRLDSRLSDVLGY